MLDRSLLLADDENHDRINKAAWVKTGQTTGYLFQALAQEIDADIETTWEVVKDVQHYHNFSNGSITVQNHEVKEGAGIGFDIRVRGSCADSTLPHSDEIISIVDDKNKILGWERILPLTPEPTERYHMLEPSPDDPKKTRSYIGLRVPGVIGFFTNLLYKKIIKDAFNDLHVGIKQEAEQRAHHKL